MFALMPGLLSAAVVGSPLLLDTLSVTVKGAWSVRKLRSAYAGACLRVRRSSDNAEQDIGWSAGVLDTAALLTFVGAGSGFVSKWYDQSSLGQDMAQTTASNQPRIALSGVVDRLGNATARPGIVNTGSSGTMGLHNTSFAYGGTVFAGIGVVQVTTGSGSNPTANRCGKNLSHAPRSQVFPDAKERKKWLRLNDLQQFARFFHFSLAIILKSVNFSAVKRAQS